MKKLDMIVSRFFFVFVVLFTVALSAAPDHVSTSLSTYPNYELGAPIPDGLHEPLNHYNHRVLSHEIAREVLALLVQKGNSESSRARRIASAVREAIVAEFELAYLEYDIARVMRTRGYDAERQRTAVQMLANRAQALSKSATAQALKDFGQLTDKTNKQIIDRAGNTIKQRILTLVDVDELPGESSLVLGKKYPVYERGDPLPKGAFKPLEGYTHSDLVRLAVNAAEPRINQFLSGHFPIKQHKLTTETIGKMKELLKQNFENTYIEYYISRTMLKKYASTQERNADIKILADRAAAKGIRAYADAESADRGILLIRRPSKVAFEIRAEIVSAVEGHILKLLDKPASARSRVHE